MNDLVVASFFVAATYFSLGERRWGAVGAGFALGLGFGTKISAPLLLPIYLIAVIAAKGRRLKLLAGSVAIGIALGRSFWYIVNRWHTSAVDGGMTAATGQAPERRPSLVIIRAYRLLLDTIELPAWSPFSDAFVCCTAVSLTAATVFLRGRRRAALASPAAAAIVSATPYLLMTEGHAIVFAWQEDSTAWGTPI